MSVFDLKKGGSGLILSVNAEGAARERLLSLGLKKGVKVTAIGFSLFNGSVLLITGFNRIALRKSVACKIEVAACRR